MIEAGPQMIEAGPWEDDSFRGPIFFWNLQ